MKPPAPPFPDLDGWIEGQVLTAKRHLAGALSRSDLVHHRPEFGQSVRPARGSVLASPVFAHWDPEPDYFYHWSRDAAIVMAVVDDLAFEAEDADEAAGWARAFADYVAFSAQSLRTDGRTVAPNPLRQTTRADCLRHLRPDAELAALVGADALLAEPRCNPDGGPDLQNWGRPQFDGPALRALTLLRHLARVPGDAAALALVRLDLAFTLAHADAPCLGPWEEEEFCRHYFTVLCQHAALREGAACFAARGETGLADDLRTGAAATLVGLEAHWDEANGVYRAFREFPAASAAEAIDSSILMAALAAGLGSDSGSGRHGLGDERLRATVAVIEATFLSLYPLNLALGPGEGPLIGRNVRDVYFGGNPWFPNSFALAEYHYARAAAEPRTEIAAADLRRGDGVLAACRRFVPEDGALCEQIDRASGAPTSARHLTWSYAAFLAAVRARARARARVRLGA
jgi:Glucoamylase and related glycosyl hydrolases